MNGARRGVPLTFAAAALAVLAVSGCGPFSPASATPDGPRPASADDLIGRWVPADGGGRGKAFVEFAEDGSWVGSDGCNGQRGTWAVEQDGRLSGTAGPSTKIFCDNASVELWISRAAHVELDRQALELRDGEGAPLGQLVRPPS